ncbi:hypothetical protein DFS34DRAFT_595450 [Phlyctochytrium arcticum]|nr:hypothetical protein DFS34DRAFT_595450 [Phlyctochytrium arcticum]
MLDSTLSEQFKKDLGEYLSTHFPSEEVEVVSEYAALLLQTGKERDELEKAFEDVMDQEAASKVSTWVFEYIAKEGKSTSTRSPDMPLSESKNGQGGDNRDDEKRNDEDMVINLDVRSDEELDGNDDDKHPRRERRNGKPANALMRAAQEAAQDVKEGRNGSRKRSRDEGDSHNNGAEHSGNGNKIRKSNFQEPSSVKKDGRQDVKFSVSLDTTSGSRPQLNIPDASLDSRPSRCTFWPNCRRGDTCAFFHPTEPCTDYPNCTRGAQCYGIHPTDGYSISAPPCRFGAGCTRPGCTFVHPAGRGGGMSASHAAKTYCRFDPHCSRPGCPYMHRNSRFPAAPRHSLTGGLPTSSGPTSASAIICKFEPFCQRPSCAFQHPSRATSICTTPDAMPPKSKKFIEPIERDPLTIPITPGRPTVNGMWKNKSLVLNAPKDEGEKPHVSERSFALPDSETESVPVDNNGGATEAPEK